MHVVRYLVAAVVAIIALSAALIVGMPDARFIDTVPLALGVGTAGLAVVTAASLLLKDRLTEGGKRIAMVGFLFFVLVPTVWATTAYIHQDRTSWSGGEVHYHADFEVIVDGEQHDLVDPRMFCERSKEGSYMCRLNDRVGVTEYHEHNDQRLHLEGTFKHRDEATLSAFFETFGGALTASELRYPTNDGWVNRTEQGNRTLKVIVERGVGGTRSWCTLDPDVPRGDRCIDPYLNEPVDTPENYVVSPYQRGPPLDTIFVIYDDTPVADALDDLRDDSAYTYRGETFEIVKSGEGY